MNRKHSQKQFFLKSNDRNYFFYQGIILFADQTLQFSSLQNGILINLLDKKATV